MKIRVAFGLALVFCLAAALLGQEPKKTIRTNGRVLAVVEDSITIRPGATTLTLAVDASTKVTGKGVGSKTRALKAESKVPRINDLVEVNDSVVVRYHDVGEGKLHATQVDIKVKGIKSK